VTKLDMQDLLVIDLSFFDTDSDALARAISKIGLACRSNGFFQISGHGIPLSLQEKVLFIAKRLYDLSPSKKNNLSLSLSSKARGYSGLGQQQLDPNTAPDMKESFYISENTASSGNLYPSEHDAPNFRAITSSYYEQMISLSQRLFRLLAASLNLPSDTFDQYSGADGTIENTYGSTLRLVHYPSTRAVSMNHEAGQLSCGAHTDFGTLTLLLQDGVSGLEIQDIETGNWFAVPALKDVYVVNIGDLMQRWTSGVFKSAPHRVILDAPVSRYSVPFFFNGSYDFTIRSFPALVNEAACQGKTIEQEPITVGEHIKHRIRMTHTDVQGYAPEGS